MGLAMESKAMINPINRVTRFLLIVVALALSSNIMLSGTSQPQVTLDELVRLIRQREAKARTLFCKWHGTSFLPKPEPTDREKSLKLPVAGEDTTVEEAISLKMIGMDWRRDVVDKALDSSTGKYEPRISTSILKGDKYINYHRRKGGFPTGLITQVKRPVPSMMGALPPFFLFRAVESKLLDFSKAKITPTRETIDGALLIRVDVTQSKTDVETFFYAPSRGTTLIRWEERSGQRLGARCDFEYKKQAGNEWAPVGWKMEMLSYDGVLIQSLAATIDLVEYNSGVDLTDFDFIMPADTLVTDDYAPQDRFRYIARADGSQRRILTNEDNAKYERLVATEAGKANDPSTQSSLSPWTVLIAILAVGSAIAIFRGRREK
jgi:hypothetical protein